MGARVAVPVAGKWRMTEPLEVWKIVLSLTSHVTPAHVDVAGPLRRKVAVPSGVLLKMLMSIAELKTRHAKPRGQQKSVTELIV